MKNLRFVFLLVIGLSFAFYSCTSDDGAIDPQTQNDDDSNPLAAVTFLDVSYGNNPQQVYDIYLPEGRSISKTKVLVLIHGGGWTAGDKSDMDDFIDLIQESHPNHAIVNINYVLAALPATPAFPNQFLDVESVLQKLTDEKELLQILPEFGLIGTSAGAHLALMYDYVYDTTDQVKMVCDIVGPSDFTDPFYTNDPNFDILLSLLVDESAYPNGGNLAELTSPVHQVSAASSPSILFYGNQDPLVPLTNGQRLNMALSDAMVDHNFTVYEGGHGDDWSPTNILDLQAQIRAFIDLHLPIL